MEPYKVSRRIPEQSDIHIRPSSAHEGNSGSATPLSNIVQDLSHQGPKESSNSKQNKKPSSKLSLGKANKMALGFLKTRLGIIILLNLALIGLSCYQIQYSNQLNQQNFDNLTKEISSLKQEVSGLKEQNTLQPKDNQIQASQSQALEGKAQALASSNTPTQTSLQENKQGFASSNFGSHILPSDLPNNTLNALPAKRNKARRLSRTKTTTPSKSPTSVNNKIKPASTQAITSSEKSKTFADISPQEDNQSALKIEDKKNLRTVIGSKKPSRLSRASSAFNKCQPEDKKCE
jgi:hypothetical protein